MRNRIRIVAAGCVAAAALVLPLGATAHASGDPGTDGTRVTGGAEYGTDGTRVTGGAEYGTTGTRVT